jgi:ketosteroid isomerase-like protein
MLAGSAITWQVMDLAHAIGQDVSHPATNGSPDYGRKESCMTSASNATERFIALCNETDAGKRHALIDQTFTEDAVYFDTVHSGSAHEGIEAAWTTIMTHVSSAEVSLTAEPDVHHDWLRMRWKLVPDGRPEMELEGTYVCRIGDDGRFEQMIGFLDKVPVLTAS